MTDKQQRPSIVRLDHDKYIELRFLESSHRAVDGLMQHLVDIVSENTADQAVRIFVNNGEVRRAQSISYLLNQMRHHQKQFNVTFPVRIAANFNMILIANLLELFVRSLPTKHIEFKAFSILDSDHAVSWLLEELSHTNEESS